MAKNKKFELDDFGFDVSLDVPDFNFEPGKIKDDRKATTKIVSGIKDGVKDTVMHPSFIRRLVKDSLPKGYGSAMDMADETAGTLKNLYNDAAKEIKPVVKDMKRVTKRMLPAMETALPRKMADRIKKWANNDPDRPGGMMAAEQMREASLQSQLGEIFKYQSEQQLTDKAENEARDTIRDSIEHDRHRDMLGQLDAMRISLQQLANYQNKVDAAYQRKSLELQFRHYFVAMDMLAEQKKFSALAQTNLEGIVKNTGLPDFVKMKNSERLKEVMRNKFIDGLNDSVFAKRRDFIRNVGSKLVGGAKEKLSGFLENVKGGLSMADSVLDMHEMQQEMGGGPGAHELAGQVAGGMLADTVGGKVGKGFRKVINKFDKNGRVDKVGNSLQFGVENAPQLITDYARSGKHETGGFFDPLVRFLKDSVLSANRVDNTVESDKLGGMQDPMAYNRGAHKSITEIIPGYLARIYRELQITRTGNDKIELTSYDMMSNKFSDKSAILKNVFKSVVKDSDREGTKNEIDSLLKELDPNGTELSPEQRKVLGQFLLRQNMRNGSGSKRLTDYDEYTGQAGRHAEKFSELFKDYFKDDKDGSKQLRFSRTYNRLGQGISDSRKTIQDHVNVGNKEALEELGLFDKGSDSINMDRLYNYFYGEDGIPSTPSPIPGPAPRRRRLGDRARNQPPAPRPAPAPAASTPAAAPAQQGPQHTPLNNPFERSSAEIIKAITDSSSKSVSQTISEILLRIEEQLKKGIATHAGEGGPGQGSGGHRGGRWWDKRLRDVGSDMWSAGQSAVSGIGKLAGRIGGGASDMMGRGLALAGNLSGKAFDKLQGIRDVYIQGELVPRLLAVKLKAGQYRDQATGTIIKSYKDIKGAVIDENGNIVLSVDEIKKSFIKTGIGKKMISALGAALNTASAIGGSIMNSLPVFYKAGIDMAKKAYGLLFQAQDVYVKGKEDPVLLARTMKAGGYYSKLTGKVIAHPGMIDGPVVDQEGNVVLSKEELAGGIYNKNGKPIRVGLAKITGAVRDMATFGLNKLKDFGQWAAKGLGGMKDGLGSLFGSVMGKDGIIFSGGKTMVERLTEIRDILQERLPKKKHIVGDADGDGIREGSYQDLKNKKKKAAEEAAGKEGESQTGIPKGKGMLGTIGGGIKSLYNRFRKKKKGGDDDDDEGSVGGDIAEDVATDAAESAGKKGFRKLRKFGKRMGGKGMLKMGGKALGVAGAAYGAYSAYDNYKQGNYGEAAVDAGLSAAGLGVSTLGVSGTLAAAGSIGGGLMTGAGAVLTGIGALISAPVVLGALAVAAIGAGAYYGYKYLSKKRLGTLSKVRYAQYGFLPTDEEHLQQVFGLEDQLMKGVVYKDGVAQLDEKKVDAKKLVDSFGIDLQDKTTVERWLQWFVKRFKPVFLTHLSALNKVNSQKGLGDVDSGLKPAEKKQYLDIAKYPEGPYDEYSAPFPSMKTLKAGPAEVKAVLDVAEAEIQKEISNAKPDATGMDAPKAAAAATAGAAAAAAAAGPKQVKEAPKLSTQVLNDVAKQNESSSGINDSRGVISSMGVPLAANKFATGKIDALTTIRYKTYGLKELILEKVRAIDALEEAVGKGVTYGKGNVAKWEGSVEKILLALGPAFGVEGVNNNNAYDWLTWFSQRFLPTYMNYLTAIAVATNKTDAKTAYVMLKAQQLVDVAMVVYTTNGKYNGSSVSVWQVPSSPWPGYELNSDVKSVEANMNGLKEDARKTVLQESKGRTASGKDAQSVNSPPASSFMGKVGNVMSRVGNGLSQVWQGMKDSASGIFGGSSAPNTNGGREILQPGNGSGGDVNSIPKPTGNKSWGALKDTINAAAKMVGVDEKLMATMAAIESGFDYTVKAASSSASGLFQFVKGTWNAMLRKYGAKYGIDPGTPATDPRANALMGAEYIKENVTVLKSALNRPLTDTDLYLAHFLGGAGAKKFLSADPKAIAANLMPDAARANPSIFFDANARPLSVGEVYAVVNGRVRNKGKQFGIDSGSEQLVTSATPKSAAPAVATGTSAPSAPAIKAANSLAVPVADQTPGTPAIPTASGGQDKAATASASKPTAPTASVDPAAAAMGSGFASPRARDLAAQTQYQKDLNNETLTSISTAMTDSNRTQSDQLAVLREIRNIMIRGKMGNQDRSAGPDAGSQSSAAQSTQKVAQAAPRAPVSMAKPTY